MQHCKVSVISVMSTSADHAETREAVRGDGTSNSGDGSFCASKNTYNELCAQCATSKKYLVLLLSQSADKCSRDRTSIWPHDSNSQRE